MSVVGLTLGIATKAIRPTTASAASAATSETTRAGGRERSNQPKPAAEREPEHEERGELPAHGRRLELPLEQLRALLGGQGGAVEDPGDVGREVAAATEHVLGRAVRDHVPLAEQHDPLGELGRQLGVVGGHEHGGASLGKLAQAGAERVLVRAVHAARGLVEAGEHGRGAAEHDLERQPLPLAARQVARVGVLPAGEARGRDARRARAPARRCSCTR